MDPQNVEFGLVAFVLSIMLCGEVLGLGEIIYAINCGGDVHTDIYGIRYEQDPAKVGTSSDYGQQLMIGRVHPDDQILYQTERYHHSTFGYDIPIKENGGYVLVLKFCEVYFNAPNEKVFDVVLNGDHTIVQDLDIYAKVGHGMAHDEMVAFTVSDGKMSHRGVESEIRGGKIRVELIKGYRDNPKVNAIYLMKGSIDDVPTLPPLELERDETEQEDDFLDLHRKISKNRRPSGPKTPDPYSSDESSMMLPVFVAIGAFIPVLFCLCKL